MAAYTVGKVMLFFLLILILGLSIGNAVYFARMSETEEADPKVSKSSAYTWMWINIMIIVVVLIGCFILGYFIYNDLKSPEKKKVKVIIDEDFVGIDIENEYTKRKKELEKQAKDMEELINEREDIQKREIAKRSVRKLQKLAQLNLEPEVFLANVQVIQTEQKSEAETVMKNSATKRGYLRNIYKVEGGAPTQQPKDSTTQNVNKLINQLKQIDNQLRNKPNDKGLQSKRDALANQIRLAGGTPPNPPAAPAAGAAPTGAAPTGAAPTGAAPTGAASNTTGRNRPRRGGANKPPGGGGNPNTPAPTTTGND